jgi:formylglycine-generating enzyme
MPKLEIKKVETEYQLFIESKLFCTLIPIPKGCFKREDGATISLNSFYIAQFQVTQEFYTAVTDKENPSYFTGVQHPVEHVSWYDAIRFCGILNKELNVNSELFDLSTLPEKELNKLKLNPSSPGFRLPTESEWEYAAKGDSPELKHSGSDILDLVGWYDANSGEETKPVGRKFPNSFGLYDMSGNVWEWCWDWYDDYSKKDLINPVGPIKGTDRVLRGGSWDHDAVRCRASRRGSDDPGDRDGDIGFRIVFVP